MAITVNGREDTVVLSHEDFVDREKYISEIEARLAVYDHLAQSADDVRLDRVQEMGEAFDNILTALDQVGYEEV